MPLLSPPHPLGRGVFNGTSLCIAFGYFQLLNRPSWNSTNFKSIMRSKEAADQRQKNMLLRYILWRHLDNNIRFQYSLHNVSTTSRVRVMSAWRTPFPPGIAPSTHHGCGLTATPWASSGPSCHGRVLDRHDLENNGVFNVVRAHTQRKSWTSCPRQRVYYAWPIFMNRI